MNEADPQLDLTAIVGALIDHAVEFLLIGGLAVQTHGNPRLTLDVDILPNPAEANMAKLAEALRALEATARDDRGRALSLDLSHPSSLAVGNYFLRTKYGPLDLFNGPRPDLKRYRRLDANAIEAPIAEGVVRVIGLDDLIRMKREAGRDKDLRDIAALTAAQRLMSEDPGDAG